MHSPKSSLCFLSSWFAPHTYLPPSNDIMYSAVLPNIYNIEQFGSINLWPTLAPT